MKNNYTTLVISYYDSGVYWAFTSGTQVFDKLSYDIGIIENKYALELCRILSKEFNPFPEIIKFIKEKHKNVKIIFCENGDIQIANIK